MEEEEDTYFVLLGLLEKSEALQKEHEIAETGGLPVLRNWAEKACKRQELEYSGTNWRKQQVILEQTMAISSDKDLLTNKEINLLLPAHATLRQ